MLEARSRNGHCLPDKQRSVLVATRLVRPLLAVVTLSKPLQQSTRTQTSWLTIAGHELCIVVLVLFLVAVELSHYHSEQKGRVSVGVHDEVKEGVRRYSGRQNMKGKKRGAGVTFGFASVLKR